MKTVGYLVEPKKEKKADSKKEEKKASKDLVDTKELVDFEEEEKEQAE